MNARPTARATAAPRSTTRTAPRTTPRAAAPRPELRLVPAAPTVRPRRGPSGLNETAHLA